MSLYEETMQWLRELAPHETEYLQAVEEVCEHIVPIVNANKAYKNNNVLQRLLLPQKIIEFAVEWENDAGSCEINKGWRVQHSNSLGPYKGGTRFHPKLNLSVLKFLAFEQSIKNALTELTLGAGKGGANFSPKGRSENEVRRFCRAYMRNLAEHIGENIDVPAGDINVSDKELGFMFGEYLNVTKRYEGALSGKPLIIGGSELRIPATGFGIIYFLEAMLAEQSEQLRGKAVLVSGAGNVALHCALKAAEKGAKVLSLSNSRGFLHSEEGLEEGDINWLIDNAGKYENALAELANENRKSKTSLCFHEGKVPWDLQADIAIPCATQNEIDKDAANRIVNNIGFGLVEGANMPCTKEASSVLLESSLHYAPGKAANAGGVILSGFEMQQNSTMRYEAPNDLAKRLEQRMQAIHKACVDESKVLGEKKINYIKGANVAGFRRIADAIVARGY
jgi:glutamate dehydrogenase (NADP+)